MKKLFIFCVIILALVVGACTRPASPSVTSVTQPTAYPAPGGQRSGTGTDGLPTPTATQPGGAELAVTATPAEVAQSTPAEPPGGELAQPGAAEPTSTPIPSRPTSTPLAPVDQNLPTATPTTGPTVAPTFAIVAFDPRTALGKPTFEDKMELTSLPNWVLPETNKLPDNNTISIEIKDNKFYITGKQIGFSTWWFSWPSLKNFYLELEANSKTCSGKDAYGLILRGPQHLAGVSYGYVVALSCDGSYWVFRLDGVEPWRAVTLVDWKASDQIRSGNNQLNVLGVRMEGDKITVFINGKSVAEVQDDEYSEGRYGLFVRPDSSYTYTYQALNIAYWDLAKITPTPKP